MRIPEETRIHRSSRAAVAAVSVALIAGIAGCGEEDFENEPRPPSPIELTAAIDKRSVTIAPTDPGAGLVVITISNQTDEPTQLVLEGPDDTASSGEIPPRGTGTIKTELVQGEYDATAGGIASIEPTQLVVGPPRESSQNDLLLP
jgi:hypothetical protein